VTDVHHAPAPARRIDAVDTSQPVRNSINQRARPHLPAGVLEDLYELISPDSTRNPFRTEANDGETSPS
jgi:hypothetical protein